MTAHLHSVLAVHVLDSKYDGLSAGFSVPWSCIYRHNHMQTTAGWFAACRTQQMELLFVFASIPGEYAYGCCNAESQMVA